MNVDEAWQETDAYRLNLIEVLSGLSGEDWRQPSLCAGWTVREALAHLTYQHIDAGTALSGFVRARGSSDRMIHDVACRRAARLSTVELIGLLKAMVGSRRHPPGVTWREGITDNLVHGQDITVPLGRRLDLPVGASAIAAERNYSMKWPPMPKDWPFHPRRGLRRFRLRATDTDWSAGEGPEVTAPIGDLLLLITGRLVVRPRLSGPGADELTAALTGQRV